MTRRSLVPAGVAARIKTKIQPNAFETQMALGHVETITFLRERVSDGADMNIGPYEMLIKLPGIGGAAVSGGPQGQTTAFVGYQGEFRARLPLSEDDPSLRLTLHREDRFCLANGSCGRLLSEPLDDKGFSRVPFVIER